MPNCPKCGVPMVGAAPHGPWPVQYECRQCGTVVVPPHEDCHQRANRLGRESGTTGGDWRDNPYTPGTRQWFEFNDGQEEGK